MLELECRRKKGTTNRSRYWHCDQVSIVKKLQHEYSTCLYSKLEQKKNLVTLIFAGFIITLTLIFDKCEDSSHIVCTGEDEECGKSGKKSKVTDKWSAIHAATARLQSASAQFLFHLGNTKAAG